MIDYTMKDVEKLVNDALDDAHGDPALALGALSDFEWLGTYFKREFDFDGADADDPESVKQDELFTKLVDDAYSIIEKMI